MFCSHCGHEIMEGMQVCAYCGAPVNANPNRGYQYGNPNGNPAGNQGVYREEAPSYSGQTWNDSGNYTYNEIPNPNNQNYTGPNYNGYGTPQNMDGGSTGLAITSLIIGIIALLASCVMMRLPVLYLLPLSGIVMGVLSLCKGPQGKGMAITGIVCNSVAIVLSVILFILTAGMLIYSIGRLFGGF